MPIKQLSVFVENKAGRLASILKTLHENSINVRALSIADTHDFGILRLITDEPERTAEIFAGEERMVKINELIGVVVPDTPGSLCRIVDLLSENKINIEYTYDFNSRSNDNAVVLLRVTDNVKAQEILKENNIELLENI